MHALLWNSLSSKWDLPCQKRDFYLHSMGQDAVNSNQRMIRGKINYIIVYLGYTAILKISGLRRPVDNSTVFGAWPGLGHRQKSWNGHCLQHSGSNYVVTSVVYCSVTCVAALHCYTFPTLTMAQ